MGQISAERSQPWTGAAGLREVPYSSRLHAAILLLSNPEPRGPRYTVQSVWMFLTVCLRTVHISHRVQTTFFFGYESQTTFACPNRWRPYCCWLPEPRQILQACMQVHMHARLNGDGLRGKADLPYTYLYAVYTSECQSLCEDIMK